MHHYFNSHVQHTGGIQLDLKEHSKLCMCSHHQYQRCYQDQGVRDQDQTKTRQAETETKTKTRQAETETETKTREAETKTKTKTSRVETKTKTSKKWS